MKRSRRMQRLVELAQHHEKEAARLLGEGLQALQQCEQQLQQMRALRSEYQKEFTGAGTPVSAAELQLLSRFTRTLDHAIAQLELQIHSHQQITEKRRREWHQQHHRANALEEIRERYRLQALRRQENRSQRELDDRGHGGGEGTE